MSENSSHADVGRTDKFLFAGDADAPYLKLVQDTDISLQCCNEIADMTADIRRPAQGLMLIDVNTSDN